MAENMTFTSLVEYYQREDVCFYNKRFSSQDAATDAYYHYHATGFPAGLPYWLSLDGFIRLSVKSKRSF